jgi:decaprenylphospho-beta-D-ribofuranose 2-oxidase
MIRSKRTSISGWGNYPIHDCDIYRPDDAQEITEMITSAIHDHYISFGMGRSYGDASLNESNGIILNTRLNHFIAFDDVAGVLTCESGVSLEEIIRYFLPKGYFLPTTPGTKFVTVGGAIANDVHGKNHHKDGCFSEFVLDFSLLLANGNIIDCSRTSHSDIFWATIGGIGLTGIILTARIQLIRVETSYMRMHVQKAVNLDEALSLFTAEDEQYQYSVAWIDCVAGGKSLGRSVLMRANHATRNELKVGKAEPLSVMDKRKLNVPFNLPSITLNRLSIRMFNYFYYSTAKNNITSIVDYDSFFYPLDSILNWNRMYGKKGFIQYQAVFPSIRGREGLIALLEKLSQSHRSSFLAILKSSGEQNKGLLSFPTKGFTLALDIPIKDDSIFRFIQELDDIVIRHGGRVYLAKDACMTQESFEAMYAPSLDAFKKIKQKVDPNHVFSSSMARRLGIVEV